MTKRFPPFPLVVSGLVLVPMLAAFGGWAAITVEDLPDNVVAGAPIDLRFAVRQHGVTLLSGLSPRVEARAGRLEASAAAVPGRVDGHYAANLVLPEAGEWTITIHSGFGPSKVTLVPIMALARGARPVAPLAESERGRRLFVAKGCVSCHVQREVQFAGVEPIGPDLSVRRFETDYLKRYLADPSIIAVRTSTAKMPNLELKPLEIASLVAFINNDRLARREPTGH